MHLRYSSYGAPSAHPQAVMRSLGIGYEKAVPQSIGDQWWFLDCTNVPETLPEFITRLEINRDDYPECATTWLT